MRAAVPVLLALATCAGETDSRTPIALDGSPRESGGPVDRIISEGPISIPNPSDASGTLCETMTCQGCCKDGTCYGGDSERACGRLSAACVECAAGEICRQRACETAPPDAAPADEPPGVDRRLADGESRCGVSNCGGCCANDVCELGIEKTACGFGGALCRVCGAMAVCDPASYTCSPAP